jgi:D-aminoacyl-tRNA deacylase
MRVIIQRVQRSSVTIDTKIVAAIGEGLLILLGIETEDSDEDLIWLCKKIANLRIFSDEQGLMNKSIVEIKGQLIVVSQFTLFASTKKGNRPSFLRSARPEIAIPIYTKFLEQIKLETQLEVQSGEFGADMKVELINDGPVTIWIDSKDRQ